MHYTDSAQDKTEIMVDMMGSKVVWKMGLATGKVSSEKHHECFRKTKPSMYEMQVPCSKQVSKKIGKEIPVGYR